MKKNFLLTWMLFVGFAFLMASCRLPASGTPPVINTPVSNLPTSTTAAQVEPTDTTIPATPVVQTNTPPPTEIPPTSAPPTPVPTATVPPTPLPPTPAPLPEAVRIQFAAGATSADLNGNIDAGETINYVLKASANQTMNVKVTSPNNDVYLYIFGADSQVYLSNTSHDTIWSGSLPKTQDYYISLTATTKTSYTLSVEIPSLQASPTPQPGEFDPVKEFGQPTFSDAMDGDNVNDWLDQATGLLPDTKYIRLAETEDKFYVTGKIAGWNTWYFTWHELGDFYLQSTFDSGKCTGKDAYGLIVRGPQHEVSGSHGYVVEFSCDGSYMVFRVDSSNPYTTEELVSWTKSDFILAGADKTNVMGIKAVGNKITIYANGHQVAEVTDAKYSQGRYGVFVGPGTTANYTYRIAQMSYWDLTK